MSYRDGLSRRPRRAAFAAPPISRRPTAGRPLSSATAPETAAARHYTPGMPREVRHRSAVPRWSHRDPVEGGNPFPDGDPRRDAWDAATEAARQALDRCDARIAATARVTLDPVVYREQLMDLALRRFDIWAERALAAVSNDEELDDYRRWLDVYAANWLRYVADTCPRVETGDELPRRLDDARKRWLKAGRAAAARPGAPRTAAARS